MELIYVIIGLALLVLGVLAVLAPYFIYKISMRCSEQVKLLQTNLEAQNQIITILWDIKNK